MPVRLLLLASLLLLPGWSDVLEPLPKAGDYQANGIAGTLAIGAEYMGPSVTVKTVSVAVPGYLVVEVGIYPAKDSTVQISSGMFTLRVNGKQTLTAQTPGMVAASLKYSDWEQPRGIVAAAGPLILGRPSQTPRFPGDQSGPESRMPKQPRAPTEAASVSRETLSPDQMVVDYALEEGRISGARRGFLYYPWKGKLKSLKSVELVFSGDPGKLTLPLL